MKIVFGSVIYKGAFPYVLDFVTSLNNQKYKSHDILLLNDNLSIEKEKYIFDRCKNKPQIFQGRVGANPSELRTELIRKAKALDYDLLILGDFDDTFSDDRILSIVKEYDPKYAFFYNELFYMNQNKKFFKKIPNESNDICDIIESNYIGLSNSAINLKLVDQQLLTELSENSNIIFDWYMYSLFLNFGLKGKRIRGGKSFYRIHDLNIAGKSDSSINSIIKEIEVKIKHYSSLKNKDIRFKQYLILYLQLKNKIENKELNILNYIDHENEYWWGKIKIKNIEME